MTRTAASAGRRPDADRPFEAPWHAAAFALVIGLYEAWAVQLAGLGGNAGPHIGERPGTQDSLMAVMITTQRG
jgi:hypothetical protein